VGEPALLSAALVLYALAIAGAMAAELGRVAVPVRLPRTLLEAAVALHTLSLVLRWSAHGHGPFTTLYEILSSNLWSLSLVFALSCLLVREVRSAFVTAAPVLLVLGSWLLIADDGRGHIPATYDTPLLYLHTLVGKIYLGLLLVAVALGVLPVLRRAPPFARLGGTVGDARFDELAHRFAALAFVFELLMLIVGAVWAQDAWGRYWAWDPLESWAFVSWIALAAALHARTTYRPAPGRFGLWLACCFALAFLTFFGVPYLSVAPHKGAI
jgi:ABC-type transport system involved in cytochrome c biogenesis permease subunit